MYTVLMLVFHNKKYDPFQRVQIVGHRDTREEAEQLREAAVEARRQWHVNFNVQECGEDPDEAEDRILRVDDTHGREIRLEVESDYDLFLIQEEEGLPDPDE